VSDLFEPPLTIAAGFEDGSTTGDAALLSRLVSGRGNFQHRSALTVLVHDWHDKTHQVAVNY
jgi:hypothetical protein